MSTLIETLKNEINGYLVDELVVTFGYYEKKISSNNYPEKIASMLKQILLDNSALFRSAQLEGTMTLRSHLFEEDEGLCPNCGKQITLDSSKDNAIVAIGLDGLSPRKPEATIGLCRNCAELLRNNKLKKDLSSIKGSLEKRSLIKKQTCDIYFDDKLSDAVKKLLKKGEFSSVQISMKSLKINQKIDIKEEFSLYNKIRMNVVIYFTRLYKLFRSLDGDEQRSYDVLSSSIKTASIIAEQKTNNKEDVFNFLVDQISSMTNCEKSIAEIIVSYFVQSCEVFHEISK